MARLTHWLKPRGLAARFSVKTKRIIATLYHLFTKYKKSIIITSHTVFHILRPFFLTETSLTHRGLDVCHDTKRISIDTNQIELLSHVNSPRTKPCPIRSDEKSYNTGKHAIPKQHQKRELLLRSILMHDAAPINQASVDFRHIVFHSRSQRHGKQFPLIST